MGPWCCHEFNIICEESLRFDFSTIRRNSPYQQSSKLPLESILASLQTLMIVIVESPTPELFLPVINNRAYDFSLVTASSTAAGVAQVHNASIHVHLRLDITLNRSIVLFYLPNIVVPMHGHC